MKRNWFAQYKFPILLLAVMALLAGVYSYTHMQVALFPEITFPKIKVIVEAGEQPVDQMSMTITRPMEAAIKKVPGLTDVRSTTSRGSLELAAFFNWGEDLDLRRQQIESQINQVRSDLPQGVTISVEKMNPSILQVMGYSLVSSHLDPMALKQLANFTIKPGLLRVPGVSDVSVMGGQDKEYWLELNPEKMRLLSVTPGQIADAVATSNFIRSSGYLSDHRSMYLSVTDARLTSIRQINQLIVKNTAGRQVRLQDIARVSVHAARQYEKIYADGRQSILIGILKQPNASVVEVADGVQRQIKTLKATLPADVQLKPYYNQADFVLDAVRSVSDCLWIGLLLAVVVAIIFLKSIKPTLTLLITIPITLGLTITVLKLTGQGLNIMTLGAIAASIGLIIDDAIVVVEQIQRTHEEFTDQSPGSLVRSAIRYLFKAMLGSSLSTVVIFIPFILMSGLAGAYFTVMTDTMIITLVCSFFSTWIFLPVIYLMLSKGAKRKRPAESHLVKEKKWVRFFIRRPVYSVIFLVLLVLVSLYTIPRLSTGFLPEMDEGTIVLDYNSPPGTTLEQTSQLLDQVDRIIAADKDVATFNRRTGTQMGFFITEPNRGDYLISLKKHKTAATVEVISRLRSAIEKAGLPLQVDFGQVIGDMLGDLMTATQPIEIQIFGPDQKTLHQVAKSVAAIVSSVPGTADVFNGITIAGPSLVMEPDFAQLARYGISAADFQSQVESYLNGNITGKVQDPLQLVPIRMIYRQDNPPSIAAISSQPVFLPGGGTRPFSDFARFHIESGIAEEQRDQLQNMGEVTARLEGRDLGSTMQEIERQIHAKIQLPSGYSIRYGGAYREQQQSFRELVLILVLSSLLVFTVILFLYKDFGVALTILLLAVFGVSGSFLLLYLTGTALNVASYTGTIMIVGIISENAVFTYAQYLESLKTMTKSHSIIYAISTRLRPKLMTAVGAIIALLPLALGIGTGAKMHQPLAIAVIGGFIVALPLLLIVLPTVLLKLNIKNHPQEQEEHK
ncbi:efflux RND transporter permease subunit [Arachidicoccus ginsenosidivorans]